MLNFYRHIYFVFILTVLLLSFSFSNIFADISEDIASHSFSSSRLSKGKVEIKIPIKISGINYSAHYLKTSTRLIKERLMEVLRRDMGATYHVSVQINKEKSQDWINISFSSASEKTEKLIRATFETLHTMSQFGVIQKDVDRMKLTEMLRLEKKRNTNDYWMQALVASDENAFPIEWIENVAQVINSINRVEVNQTLHQIYPKNDYRILYGL